MEETKNELNYIQEKTAREKSGWAMLAVVILLFVLGIVCLVCALVFTETDGIPEAIQPVFVVVTLLLFLTGIIFIMGFKLLQPNEAYVFTLFGKYYGTLKRDGFYWVNPFCVSVNPARFSMGSGKRLSLKAMTLNNDKQKVNDEEGNPIEISVVVIWRICNTASAVFNVENYSAYISTQCDAAIRQVARQYPYDVSSNGDEKSLRASRISIPAMATRVCNSLRSTSAISCAEPRRDFSSPFEETS